MDNFIPFLINFVFVEKSYCGKGFNYFLTTTILMNKFSYLIYLDNKRIQLILKFDSSKQGGHIWQVRVIQIVASSSEYNIPIGDDLLYNSNNENKNKKFITSFEAHKEICVYLLKLCSNNKAIV